MKIKWSLAIVLVSSLWHTGFSQEIKNPFFATYSIIEGDSVYNTFDGQVKFLKETGYSAIEMGDPKNFDAKQSALKINSFPGAYFYFMVDAEQPKLDPQLKIFISKLKGTKTILAPYIKSSSKKFGTESPTPEKDEMVVKLLRELSYWAKKENLQVAIYPHFGFYVERTTHALQLVKQINRKNTGLTFNLCHWLATTAAEERGMLKPHLKDLLPYLKMMIISGANDVVSEKEVIWDDYILPLGKGTFDTYGLVRYAIKTLRFKNPIGVQCYGIKDNKAWLVKHTMDTWKSYKVRMESEQ